MLETKPEYGNNGAIETFDSNWHFNARLAFSQWSGLSKSISSFSVAEPKTKIQCKQLER